jgi:hypothetical protein
MIIVYIYYLYTHVGLCSTVQFKVCYADESARQDRKSASNDTMPYFNARGNDLRQKHKDILHPLKSSWHNINIITHDNLCSGPTPPSIPSRSQHEPTSSIDIYINFLIAIGEYKQRRSFQIDDQV